MKKLNLISALQWLELKIDQSDIPANQQLVMFHIVLKLNKNFWSPAQVSINKLSAAMNVSKRTVSTAINALVEQGYIYFNENNEVMINVSGKSKSEDTVASDSNVELPDNVCKLFGAKTSATVK